MKQRVVKHNQVPYMNSQLRKAINVHNMLRRKFDRSRSGNGGDGRELCNKAKKA